MRSDDKVNLNFIGKSSARLKAPHFLLLAPGARVYRLLVLLAIVVVVFLFLIITSAPNRDEDWDAELATTKLLTEVCEVYKKEHGEWPPDLDALCSPRPPNGIPMVDPSVLERLRRHNLHYDKNGPHHDGLKPDIWIDFPGGELGNWMKKKR